MKIALSLLLLLTSALSHAATDLPTRKAGLWEHRMQMSQTGSFTHAVHVCTDGSMDDMAIQQGSSNCSKLDIRRDGDRISVESVCKAGGSTATSRGSFSGDFARQFAGQLSTTFSPPLNGMTQNVMRMEARWLGPCQAGQQPGDVIMQGLPGGINLNELMKQLPGAR